MNYPLEKFSSFNFNFRVIDYNISRRKKIKSALTQFSSQDVNSIPGPRGSFSFPEGTKPPYSFNQSYYLLDENVAVCLVRIALH